jgi:hypothetical protein
MAIINPALDPNNDFASAFSLRLVTVFELTVRRLCLLEVSALHAVDRRIGRITLDKE